MARNLVVFVLNVLVHSSLLGYVRLPTIVVVSFFRFWVILGLLCSYLCHLRAVTPKVCSLFVRRFHSRGYFLVADWVFTRVGWVW